MTSVCTGIVPVLPLAVAPVTLDGELEDQLYVTPDVVDDKVTATDDCPEQIVCGAGLKVTLGAGLTVMVND